MRQSSGIRVDSVKKNLFYQSTYQILSIILPFITAPYISRVLGTTGTGIYSYVNSVMYFFLIVANLGVLNYGNREIASCIYDKELLSKTFWGIYFCHTLATIISIIVYIFFVLFFSHKYRFYLALQIIQLFASLVDISWFFSGIQKFKITVKRNFIIRIITLLCIFVFIKDKEDVWKYLMILSVGNLIGQIVVWTQIKQYVDFVHVNFREITSHIKPLFILFIPIVATGLYRYMDKIMIPYFSDISELGLYENSEKIIALPLNLITTIGIVLLPKMASITQTGDTNKVKKYFKLSMKCSLIIALGLAAGLAGIAPIFAPIFFGEDFRLCGKLIPLLSITIIFLTISNSINLQLLIPYKKDYVFIFAAFSGAIINLAINVIMIPIYGAKGAVIATIITEVVVCAIDVLYTFKSVKYSSLLFETIPFIVSSLLMYIFVRFLGVCFEEKITTILIQVIIGALFYFSSTFFILWNQKDAYFCSLLNEIKSKLLHR